MNAALYPRKESTASRFGRYYGDFSPNYCEYRHWAGVKGGLERSKQKSWPPNVGDGGLEQQRVLGHVGHHRHSLRTAHPEQPTVAILRTRRN